MTVRGPRVVAAEVALLGVSLAVVFGFGRLFADRAWLLPLVAVAVGTHAVTAGLRRLRIGIVTQILVVAVGLVLALGWIVAPETHWFGLPTSDTFEAISTAIADAGRDYPSARAPVEVTDGFVALSALGIALVALMANVAAFDLRAPLQALVPPFTLFVLCSLLGSGDHRVAAAIAFVASCLAFVLCVRGIDATTTTTWLPGDARRGPDAVMRLGVGLIAASTIAAAVVGPALPGAADDGLWTWRGGGGGPGKRMIMSPLVDIQARLVNQSREVAFTVTSPEPAYWRMMALDEFTGRDWRVNSNFRPVSGSFGTSFANQMDDAFDQRFEIQALASEYLPAAFNAVAVEADVPVTWDDRSATLLLDERARRGLSYQVRSVMPEHTADELRAAPERPPPAIATRYLQLPDLDPRVAELAREVTAEAPTHYDQALALQTFFREEFDYSLEIPQGSDEDAIIRFLFEQRIGYCEQFAASFAAMARTLGIPSRVAVGFNEGSRSRSNPEFFTVRGADAHAWPEIYFAGMGWIQFEPTPGRVAPGAEAWTGLSTSDQDPDEPSTGLAPPTEVTEPTLPPDLSDLFPELDAGGAAAPVADEGFRPPPALVWTAVALAAATAWTLLVTGLARLRRERRRRRFAEDPNGRVGVAWIEAVEAMARRGRVPREAETFHEFAQRAANTSPTIADELAELAQLTTAARFSPDPVDTELVDRSVELSTLVVHTTTAHLPWWRRLLLRADPRALRGLRTGSARQRATILAPG